MFVRSLNTNIINTRNNSNHINFHGNKKQSSTGDYLMLAGCILGTGLLSQVSSLKNENDDRFERIQTERYQQPKSVINAPNTYLAERFGAKDTPNNLFYQLNMASAVDNAKYTKVDDNNFFVDMELDKYDIHGEVEFNNSTKNKIKGSIYIRDKEAIISKSKELNFVAEIPQKGSNEFKVRFTDKDNGAEYKLRREQSGKLYLIDNGKKIQLNEKAFAKYDEKQNFYKEYGETYEEMDKIVDMLHVVCGLLMIFSLVQFSNAFRKEN